MLVSKLSSALSANHNNTVGPRSLNVFYLHWFKSLGSVAGQPFPPWFTLYSRGGGLAPEAGTGADVVAGWTSLEAPPCRAASFCFSARSFRSWYSFTYSGYSFLN